MIVRIIIITVGMAFAIPTVGFCQPDTLWTSANSNFDMYLQVIRTNDGGYAIGSDGGNRRGDGHVDTDYKIAKLDSSGNLVWERQYSGMPHERHVEDQGYTITQTPDGCYVLGGGGGGTAVMIRTDSEGDTLWMRYYDRDELPRPLNSMEALVAPDGNIYVVSYNTAAKIDIDDGEVIWGLEFDAYLGACELINDGGFLAGGKSYSNNVTAIKIDSEGNVEWQEIYEAEESEGCSGITPVTAGGWCLAGTSRFGNEPREVYPVLTRIDDDGELIWKRVIEEFDEGDCLHDVVETPDGGFAACGFGSWGSFYYLLRVDYSGEVLWRTYYGLFGRIAISGEAYSILSMEDGGYLLGGFSELGCWLVCTEPDPVDIPFELEAGEDMHSYRDVPIDSVSAWELELRNVGWRYVVIDSLWFEGDASAFACPLDLPFRMEPEDTSFVPIFFQPPTDSFYNATLILPYGNDRTLDIELWGRGVFNSVSDDFILHPYVFSLSPACPNPFNSRTNISFILPEKGQVEFAVFDALGRRVSFETKEMSAGCHTVVWSARDMSAGTYLLKVTALGVEHSQKLVLVK